MNKFVYIDADDRSAVEINDDRLSIYDPRCGPGEQRIDLPLDDLPALIEKLQRALSTRIVLGPLARPVKKVQALKR